jgi:GST-like protein
VLDTRLAGRDFLAGDDYTIADIACYPRISPYNKAPLDLEPFAELRRWQAAIRARPATQRAYARAKEFERPTELSTEQRRILFGS